MAEDILYLLRPLGPTHIGVDESKREEATTFPHSDTLFSGLCNCYHLLYGGDELDAFIKKFSESAPPLLLSSAFPWIEGIGSLYPKPLSLSIPKDASPRDVKVFKKLKYLPERFFEDVVSGKTLSMEEVREAVDQTKEKWTTIPTPRVALDRIRSSSELFHSGKSFYASDVKLWFTIKYFDTALKNKIEAALRLLGDDGIGGLRSTGGGHFELFHSRPFQINAMGGAEHFTTLSLYHPAKDEEPALNGGFYEIIPRGGWVYSPYARGLRRKRVRMLSEGSVIRNLGKTQGDVVVVREADDRLPHPVLRYGLAYQIPTVVRVED
jgi:CRISPR-associated protein Csm4